MKLADKKNKKEIMKLYRSCIGKNGCTWSMEYPNEEIFDMDVRKGNLLCITNDDDEIIGVVSIDEDPEVENLRMWNSSFSYAAELARVAVREDYRNKGVATKMISQVLDELRLRGCDGVHLLVCKENHTAMRCYQKLGFKNVGETDILHDNWWCYEREL